MCNSRHGHGPATPRTRRRYRRSPNHCRLAAMGTGAPRPRRADLDRAVLDGRAGDRAAAPADRGVEARGHPGAVRGLRREDGAAPAPADREGRHGQQHRALFRGSRRGSDREVASRPEDQAAQLRLVHGAARVVPGRRAARPLVRRRRRRYQLASSGTTTRSATRPATASSSASRASCPTRSAPRTSWRSSARAKGATCTPASAATNSAS